MFATRGLFLQEAEILQVSADVASHFWVKIDLQKIKSLDFNRLFLKGDNKKGAKNTFTCVTCHPKDDCVATGHEDGKIRLW